MYLLTEWERWTGKYLAQGQDVRTACSKVCVLTESQIFSHLAQPHSVNKHFII